MTTQAEELVVRRAVRVERPIEDAFRVFTDGIATWWPLDTHSKAGDHAETAVLEGRNGGRLYEKVDDGTEHDWGAVTHWEPPHRVAFSWRITGVPTHVDVTFTPDGDGTRVELVHRGFERLADPEATHSSYSRGWQYVLGRYAAAS